MKSSKFKEISDEMIGMDERVCNCASKVTDMILSPDNNNEGAEGVTARGNIRRPLKKGKGVKSISNGKKRKGSSGQNGNKNKV